MFNVVHWVFRLSFLDYVFKLFFSCTVCPSYQQSKVIWDSVKSNPTFKTYFGFWGQHECRPNEILYLTSFCISWVILNHSRNVCASLQLQILTGDDFPPAPNTKLAESLQQKSKLDILSIPSIATLTLFCLCIFREICAMVVWIIWTQILSLLTIQYSVFLKIALL